jgi:pullulanase
MTSQSGIWRFAMALIAVSSTALASDVPAGTMRVHYHRNDGAYTNWGVYSWSGPTAPSSGWPGNRFVFNVADGDGWGEHVDIALKAGVTDFAFLITLPNASNTEAAKDCTPDRHFKMSDVATSGQEIWVVSGSCTVYTSEPPGKSDSVSPK